MHKVWPDSLKINMRFNFPLFFQTNWATPLSVPWGRILQISSLKLRRHYKWWVFGDCPFENFNSFYPKDCPKMLEWSWNFVKTWNLVRYISYMIMNTVATSGFLGRPQKSHFFQPSLKKSQFSLKIYPLKITSQKKSNSKFLWHC